MNQNIEIRFEAKDGTEFVEVTSRFDGSPTMKFRLFKSEIVGVNFFSEKNRTYVQILTRHYTHGWEYPKSVNAMLDAESDAYKIWEWVISKNKQGENV